MASKDFQLKVNPEILVWARTTIEFAPAYAAQELHLPEGELEKLEAGSIAPSYELIVRMAHLYKRPLGAFLLNEVPNERPLPKDFRTVASEELEHFHDKTLLTIRRVRGLVSDAIELRNEMGVAIPEWNLSSSMQQNPENIASEYRILFNVQAIDQIERADDALDFLIGQFESKGILVFQMSLTQDEVRGFSLTDEVVPVIVIRRGGERATAKLFTLFHELGHILLRDGGICNFKEYGAAEQIEKWCNQFAASVLVPLHDLLTEDVVRAQRQAENKYWLLITLARLGEKRHVGPEVILRRLYNANLATRQFYEEKHEKWSMGKAFGRGSKPRDRVKEKVKEKGKTFTRLALRALDEQRISLKDFADYMDVRIEQANQVQAYL